jgi:hypothetical protein
MIAIAAELDLEQRAAGGLSHGFGGGRSHGGGGPKRDRKGGGERVRGGETCELMDRTPAALGFEIPECAIERIAGGTGRHRDLQAPAIETAGEQRLEGLDLRHDALDAFAVASIGYAFAAAARLAVAQFGDHDHGLGLGAAADREGTGDRPAFGSKGEG